MKESKTGSGDKDAVQEVPPAPRPVAPEVLVEPKPAPPDELNKNATVEPSSAEREITTTSALVVLGEPVKQSEEADLPVRLRFDGGQVEVSRITYALKTSVATLRARLVKAQAMEKSDSFLIGKVLVRQAAEDKLAVQELLKADGIVSLQRRKLPEPVTAPELPKDPRMADAGNFRALPDQLAKIERGKATKSDGDVYMTLEPEAKRFVLNVGGVTSGVLMKNGQITWSYRNVVPIDTAVSAMRVRVPQHTFVSTDVMTFDRTQREIRSTIGGSASVGASFWGVGASAEVSGSKADAKLAIGSTAYTYSELTVPKVQLQLAAETIDASCLEDLEWFAGKDGQSFAEFERLRRFFEDWGAYLPVETVMGGKLFMTDEKTVSSLQEAHKFEIAAKAAFKSAAVQGSAAVSRTGSESSEDERQARTALLQSIGGDPGLVGDPAQWAASLGSYKQWRPCKVERMRPLYEFATPAAQLGIFNVLKFWSQLWRTDQMMLDFDQYLYPLARKQALRPLERRSGADANKVERAEAHSPSVLSNAIANLVVAEREGVLVMRSIGKVEGSPLTPSPIHLRSSPLVIPSADGMKATVVVNHGDKRTLAHFIVELVEKNKPEAWEWKVSALTDKHNGVEGEPVAISGPPPEGTVGAFAIRWANGIAIYGVKSDGTIADAFGGHRFDAKRSYTGTFSGFMDKGRTINLVLPTSPIINSFHSPSGEAWGERTLKVGRPSGRLAALETWHRDGKDDKQTFHVLGPTSNGKLRYFRGLESWHDEDIPTGMRDPEILLDGDRIIVLGRVGQELQGFSIDVENGVGRVNAPKAPFASGITGNPSFFMDTRPNGVRQVAAIVYVETDKVMQMWYDHGTDDWSILPP